MGITHSPPLLLSSLSSKRIGWNQGSQKNPQNGVCLCPLEPDRVTPLPSLAGRPNGSPSPQGHGVADGARLPECTGTLQKMVGRGHSEASAYSPGVAWSFFH